MLRLNRPFKQNAINTFMVEHLIVALKVFQNRSTSDAAILYAKGDDFSLGYDLWHFDKLFCVRRSFNSKDKPDSLEHRIADRQSQNKENKILEVPDFKSLPETDCDSHSWALREWRPRTCNELGQYYRLR